MGAVSVWISDRQCASLALWAGEIVIGSTHCIADPQVSAAPTLSYGV